jgi:hypothetical protein
MAKRKLSIVARHHFLARRLLLKDKLDSNSGIHRAQLVFDCSADCPELLRIDNLLRRCRSSGPIRFRSWLENS